jgi:hypothetical protein
MSAVSLGVTNNRALEPENPLRYRTFADPVTSKPSRRAAVIPSASAANRCARWSVTVHETSESVMARETSDETPQSKLVTEHAEAAYDAHRRAGEH